MSNKQVQNNKNFYFMLKCAAALTAAALVTAGIIAAVATKTGGAALLFVPVVASPIVPILIGLAATVGLLCCLPFLFVGGSSRRSSWFSPGFFGSSIYSRPYYNPICPTGTIYRRDTYRQVHFHGDPGTSVGLPPMGGPSHVHRHGGGQFGHPPRPAPSHGGHVHAHR